jgi:hypothetical protein
MAHLFVGLAVLLVVVIGVRPQDAAAGGTMYWTDVGANKIQRVTLGGVGLKTLVTKEKTHIPMGLALDVAGEKVYWIDSIAVKVQRANLDGSGVEDLVTNGLTFR